MPNNAQVQKRDAAVRVFQIKRRAKIDSVSPEKRIRIGLRIHFQIRETLWRPLRKRVTSQNLRAGAIAK